ncbi:hypothetical protein FO519_008395 [Halicephalobus sp. NKZ332]|nr:hypothetical protein FO519_008395 [Halicephalobus sp. NKZ332]
MFICSIYVCSVMVATYLMEDPKALVLCGPGMIFTGFMVFGFLYVQGFCYGLAVLTYVSIWIVLRFRKDKVSLLKPISIILGVIVGGWIFNVVLGLFLMKFTRLNFEQNLIIRTYAGITINIGTASDFYIFWFCSKEYRSAFIKQLRLSSIFKDNQIRSIQIASIATHTTTTKEKKYPR